MFVSLSVTNNGDELVTDNTHENAATKFPNESPLGILKLFFFMAGVFDAISNRKKHLPAHSTLLQLYSHNGPFNKRF